MAETLILTTPQTKPSTAAFTLERVTIDAVSQSFLIQWRGDTGDAFSAVYPTPAPAGSSQPSGQQLLSTINKRNFSGANDSFVKQMYTRLQTDGYIAAGSVTGTPT